MGASQRFADRSGKCADGNSTGARTDRENGDIWRLLEKGTGERDLRWWASGIDAHRNRQGSVLSGAKLLGLGVQIPARGKLPLRAQRRPEAVCPKTQESRLTGHTNLEDINAGHPSAWNVLCCQKAIA